MAQDRASTAYIRRLIVAQAVALLVTATLGPSTYAGPELPSAPIYAQELVNQTLAAHPDLLVVAMHVTPPNTSHNVIIASNIGRIGKRADAEDLKVISTGETLAKINKNSDRFEVELVLRDAAKRPIGALAIVFPYKPGDDKTQFEKRAEAIRDELGARISEVASLMQPYPTRPAR
jgi:hypothetical protein